MSNNVELGLRSQTVGHAASRTKDSSRVLWLDTAAQSINDKPLARPVDVAESVVTWCTVTRDRANPTLLYWVSVSCQYRVWQTVSCSNAVNLAVWPWNRKVVDGFSHSFDSTHRPLIQTPCQWTVRQCCIGFVLCFCLDLLWISAWCKPKSGDDDDDNIVIITRAKVVCRYATSPRHICWQRHLATSEWIGLLVKMFTVRCGWLIAAIGVPTPKLPFPCRTSAPV